MSRWIGGWIMQWDRTCPCRKETRILMDSAVLLIWFCSRFRLQHVQIIPSAVSNRVKTYGQVLNAKDGVWIHCCPEIALDHLWVHAWCQYSVFHERWYQYPLVIYIRSFLLFSFKGCDFIWLLWHPNQVENAYVINLGDMLGRWTAHRFKRGAPDFSWFLSCPLLVFLE